MPAAENERVPPNWLNKDYFTAALREGLKQPALEITSCVIKPATAVGDNYASIMFRAQLNIVPAPGQQQKPLSVVCKTLPPGEFQDMVKEQDIFGKEALVFAKILPAIRSVLKKIDSEEEPLSAELLWFGKDPEDVIILQDLKELGFSNLDRMSGLDLHATNMVLRGLARLHAGSLWLAEKTPEVLKGAEDNMWLDKSSENMPNMLNSSLKNLIAAVKEWEDTPRDWIDRLERLRDTMMDKLDDALRFDEKSLNVLQHGDCWINNIMFKSENGSLTGLRFVDFQISCMNSAAMDLNYFIFTSPKKEIRLSKIDEMLQTYYNTFMDLVSNLNLVLPRQFTVEELKREFRERAFFGLMATIIVYPITVTESKDVMDVNEFFDEGDKKKKMYLTKQFIEVFRMVFPYFIECGVV